MLADAVEIMCVGFIMADLKGITTSDKGNKLHSSMVFYLY